MKPESSLRRTLSAILFFLIFAPCRGQMPPARPSLPGIDRRHEAQQVVVPSAQKSEAVGVLHRSVPLLKVEFDPVTGSPKSVLSADGFLTGPEGKGATISTANLAGFATNDSNRVTKAFLSEQRALFGHGPEALDQARIQREYVTPHNGLQTVVWEQQVDGIAVFEASADFAHDEQGRTGQHLQPIRARSRRLRPTRGTPESRGAGRARRRLGAPGGGAGGAECGGGFGRDEVSWRPAKRSAAPSSGRSSRRRV